MKRNLFKLSLFFSITCCFLNCSSDDGDDCPENMVVNINDPESVARAEDCGLTPARPVGVLSNSDSDENLYIYE